MSFDQSKPLYEITHTTKDDDDVLITVKGKIRSFDSADDTWGKIGSWGPRLVKDVYHDIKKGRAQFGVLKTGTNNLVPVRAVDDDPDYIRSQANSDGDDNLDALPEF